MASESSNFRWNLLASPSVMRVVRSRLFPYALQLAALAVFVLLVVNGLRTGGPESYDAALTKTLRKTNLTTLVVWGLWWPGVILATIALGRVWCTVCPMELVGNLLNRLGRAAGLSRWELPGWIRAGFAALLAYVVLQLLVAGFEVHRAPLYTASILLGLLTLTALAGLLFREPRAFCKGFCPANLLLDVYSRLSMVRLRKSSDRLCAECVSKDCVRADCRDKLDARSCPSFLRPSDLDEDDACVLCFQCAKICPHDNIGFGVRARHLADRIARALPLPIALFVFIDAGFVSHELCEEVRAADRLFHYVPETMAALFGAPGALCWFEALWFLAIFPTIILGIMWLAALATRARYPLGTFMARTALFLVPVSATGHAIKCVFKMNGWSTWLPGALKDPTGLQTAQAIASKTIQAPGLLLPGDIASLMMITVLVVVCVATSRAIRGRLDVALRKPAYLGIGLLTGIYSLVVLMLLMN
jgi:hypothetical protein